MKKIFFTFIFCATPHIILSMQENKQISVDYFSEEILQNEADKYHLEYWHFKNKGPVSREDIKIIQEWENKNFKTKIQLCYRLDAIKKCQYCSPFNNSYPFLEVIFEKD